MRWYHDVAYLLGGVFLANAVPHLVNGMSGNAFQSPCATPPGEGLSSSTVNTIWGFANLVVSYILLGRVGRTDLRRWRDVGALAAGFFSLSLMLARHFGRLHGGWA